MNPLTNKTYLLTFLLVIILILIIFPFIFSNHLISGGDYTLLTTTYLQFISHNSFSSWVSTYDFGQNATALLNYAPYNFLMGVAASIVNWNGVIIERIFWWIPFFILAFVSHFFLIKIVSIKKFGFLSTFIFLFNTYTLMMLGGGQIAGVGMAYVMMPIVLVNFITLIDSLDLNRLKGLLTSKEIVKKVLLCGLLFALQAIFDLRFAYVTLFAIGIYALLKIGVTISRKNARFLTPFIIYAFVIPLCITGFIHAFWIVPIIVLHQNPVAQFGAIITSVKSVQYFSFAKFEDSISLLHPYWPQNIFGEVSFMRPEFIVLPIIAFMSLLFIKKEKKESLYIIYFALLALLGAFLSKGATDPFGGIYLWLFGHIPGFVMFRDPTKFYMLAVVSYSILIPYSLFQISKRVSSIKYQVLKNYGAYIVGIVFILFWLCTIHQAVLGQLTGTFISQPVSSDYKKLNSFLSSQNSYFRTLWLPVRQKYGMYSLNHPALSANDFLQVYSPKSIIKAISQPSVKRVLEDSSIKYIVVPDDTDGTIYLTDRKFDKKQYTSYVTSLEKIGWLKQVKNYGKNKVFEVLHTKSHFWSPDTHIVIHDNEIEQTKYMVTIKNGKKNQRVVFSENYDSFWKAQLGNTILSSQKFDGRYNSFILPKNGNYSMTLSYEPQTWVNRGMIISIITAVIVISLIIFL